MCEVCFPSASCHLSEPSHPPKTSLIFCFSDPVQRYSQDYSVLTLSPCSLSTLCLPHTFKFCFFSCIILQLFLSGCHIFLATLQGSRPGWDCVGPAPRLLKPIPGEEPGTLVSLSLQGIHSVYHQITCHLNHAVNV